MTVTKPGSLERAERAKTPYDTSYLTLEILAGTSINAVAITAQRISDMLGVGVHFTFNGMPMTVYPASTPDVTVRKYNRALEAALEEASKHD